MGAIAFCASVVAGGPFVRQLRARSLGKEISTEGPSTHLVKAGTPTMGGLLFIAIASVVALVGIAADEKAILILVGAMVAAGTIGFLDDFLTLQGRQRIDPHSRAFGFAKFVSFAIIGLTVGLLFYYAADVRETFVPWVGSFDVHAWYIPIVAFVMVATIVSLALTDGLDGLAGGTTGIAFLAYSAIALAQGQDEVGAFGLTMLGALLGFLWFNSHPAQMFMGDTGALALGAAVATMAFMTGHWLLLPVIGVVFVAETVSVASQVIYFKLTGGRRLLRMSPLHHHFELIGWSEPQVVLRFWLIGGLGALLGVALAFTD